MLGMLNKDLTPFLFGIHQNRTSERKALLAECLRSSVMLQQSSVGNNTMYVTNRTSVCIVLMGFYDQMCFGTMVFLGAISALGLLCESKVVNFKPVRVYTVYSTLSDRW